MCVSVLKDKLTPGNPSWSTRVCVHACVWFAVLLTWGARENTEVRKPFLYYGFCTLVYVLQFSVLQFPYFGFHISISVLPCSYFCISILQCFPLAPTCDGSPGETTVSE